MLEFTKAEAKQWAKENLKGLEGTIFPSFTPDLSELDEEGIRWDVQHAIKNGLTGLLAGPEVCGMTFEERKKFVEIVNDEASGKLLTSVAVLQDTIEQDIEMLHHHEKTGGTFVLLGHPVQYYPRSAEDIYQMYKYMCDSTNLAVNFYPARIHTKSLHPMNFPIEIVSRIADIPNVVGMKIGGGSPPTVVAEYFNLVGDKILVNDPSEEMWPITVAKYGQQWAGASGYSAYQTPDNPRVIGMFDLFVKGEFRKAMDIYWQLSPMFDARAGMQGQVSYYHTSIIHGQVSKYWEWCTGGNGGTLRQPTGRLHDYQKQAIRAAIKTGGLTPREAPEEEFYVGRVNYAKGARLKSFQSASV